MPEFGGIVEESLKCSIFGIFGKNFKHFQQQHDKDDKKDAYLNFFPNSEILTEDLQLFKALLYFNLDYETIIKNVLEPKKIFEYRIEGNDDKNERDIGKLIEQFEQSSGGKNKEMKGNSSILLMKIDMGTDEEGLERSYIIGGYASDGWLIKEGREGKGDETCFLFNLTLNLRFNARPGMPYYQSTSKDFIRFGNTDLVVKDGFNTVTSHITLPNSSGAASGNGQRKDPLNGGSHFFFGNDLTQKNRVDSLIPGEHKYTPSKLEVWAFGN